MVLRRKLFLWLLVREWHLESSSHLRSLEKIFGTREGPYLNWGVIGANLPQIAPKLSNTIAKYVGVNILSSSIHLQPKSCKLGQIRFKWNTLFFFSLPPLPLSSASRSSSSKQTECHANATVAASSRQGGLARTPCKQTGTLIWKISINALATIFTSTSKH